MSHTNAENDFNSDSYEIPHAIRVNTLGQYCGDGTTDEGGYFFFLDAFDSRFRIPIKIPLEQFLLSFSPHAALVPMHVRISYHDIVTLSFSLLPDLVYSKNGNSTRSDYNSLINLSQIRETFGYFTDLYVYLDAKKLAVHLPEVQSPEPTRRNRAARKRTQSRSEDRKQAREQRREAVKFNVLHSIAREKLEPFPLNQRLPRYPCNRTLWETPNEILMMNPLDVPGALFGTLNILEIIDHPFEHYTARGGTWGMFPDKHTGDPSISVFLDSRFIDICLFQHPIDYIWIRKNSIFIQYKLGSNSEFLKSIPIDIYLYYKNLVNAHVFLEMFIHVEPNLTKDTITVFSGRREVSEKEKENLLATHFNPTKEDY